VAAFRATLEEVTAADLIVHVRDISHPDTEAQRRDVEAVLDEIGVRGEGGAGIPTIEAWNKLDLLDAAEAERVAAEADRRGDVVALSALAGHGVDTLARTLGDMLTQGSRVHDIELSASDGAAIAWLHANGEVLTQESEGEILRLAVRLSEKDWARFAATQDG